MGILSKKVLRDIRYNKGRSISIILIVVISTGLYGGLLLSYENITQTFDNNDKTTNIESVRYIFPNGTLADGIDLSQFNQYLDGWDTRLAIVTALGIENDDAMYTGAVFGISTANRPKVNDFILDGDYFQQSNSLEILVTRQFMENHDLDIGDKMGLHTPNNIVQFTIIGSVFSSEYIYNVNPKSGLPDITGLAGAWIPLQTAQLIYNQSGLINEVIVRFSDNVESDQDLKLSLTNEIADKLKEIDPNISYVAFEDEPEQAMKNADVDSLDDFARIFGGIILILALFAIYDNISKLITSQRNYIGTMRALGGKKGTIVLHYTSIGVILGAIGTLVGIPVGWLIGKTMTTEYSNLLGIPKPSTAFQIPPFVEAVAINLSLVALLSILSALSAARITPLQAMASSFISMDYNKKPIFEKLLNKLPGMNTPSISIPIRGIFRARRRTILTVFTYAISMILMISALGFTDSFNQAIDENYTHYEKYDLQAYFYEPLDLSSIQPTLDAMEGLDIIEGFIAFPILVSKGNSEQNSMLFGFKQDSQLRSFKLEGTSSFDGLLLGKNLAKSLDVSPGEDVNIMNATVSVNGIANEMIADSAYIPLSLLQNVTGMGNLVNGMIISVEVGNNIKSIKNNLLQSDLPISLVISTEEVRQSIEILIQGMMAMIYIMVIIGIFTVALFSFNTVVLDVMMRKNEFVNIRSLGGRKRNIAKIITFQGFLISFVGSLLAIPIGYIATDYVLKAMVQDIMVLPTYILPQSYAVAIVSAFLASLTGIYAAIRYVMKIDMVDALRTRISN